MSDKPEEPQVVVDEDWKARVAAERRAAREAQRAASDAERHQGPAPDPSAAAEIPEASFPILVSSLATTALVALGQLADPSAGHPVVRPHVARHYIDLLDMLEQKTKGNLTQDEADVLSAALHQLRMLYVMVYKSPEAAKQES
jgi:hypothetical protein